MKIILWICIFCRLIVMKIWSYFILNFFIICSDVNFPVWIFLEYFSNNIIWKRLVAFDIHECIAISCELPLSISFDYSSLIILVPYLICLAMLLECNSEIIFCDFEGQLTQVDFSVERILLVLYKLIYLKL